MSAGGPARQGPSPDPPRLPFQPASGNKMDRAPGPAGWEIVRECAVNDGFGDRMKEYERIETDRRFLPLLPVYARIDGRAFSKFTLGLKRPYDPALSAAMIETTKHLVEHTHARIGYTQSDEISLVWLSESHDCQIFFDGKIHKMVSVLASMATAAFLAHCHGDAYLRRHLENRNLPTFDCRVFQLPNKVEAANALLWRELDAAKNSVSMAAHHYFSHEELQGVSSAEMQEMLWQRAGINWNDYPRFFKRGTFVRREKILRTLAVQDWARIPEPHRPPLDARIMRSDVVEVDMPRFSTVTNRVEVVFDGAPPLVAA